MTLHNIVIGEETMKRLLHIIRMSQFDGHYKNDMFIDDFRETLEAFLE